MTTSSATHLLHIIHDLTLSYSITLIYIGKLIVTHNLIRVLVRKGFE
jgi:hypothetical protein